MDTAQAAALERVLVRLREQRDRPSVASIHFDPSEGAIRTTAQLGSIRDVAVLVDTGASLTAISEALARRLGFDLRRPARTVQVNTANGQVTVPVVVLRHVDLHGARQTQVEAVVLPLEEPGGSQALIGLNFLQAFDINIDSERGILKLSPVR